MITKLAGFVDPSVKGWDNFLTMLRTYLTEKEVAEVQGMKDAFSKLMRKNIIRYGEYDDLEKIFTHINHSQCLKLLEKTTHKIQDLKEQTRREKSKINF